MKKQTPFDVIVLGSGSAGFSATEGALSVGARVCIIEEGKFGGECPNFACIPSKASLKAAKIFQGAKRAREFGTELGTLSYDFEQVTRYRQRAVEAITGGGKFGDRYMKILTKLGVTMKQGHGTFVDKHIVRVSGEDLYGHTIVLATGSEDFIPLIPGLKGTPYWSWKDALLAKRQPKTLAIIGGGPVGCELATFFASFGTRVTLLQSAPSILNKEDVEIAGRAQSHLSALGVEVMMNVSIQEVINACGGILGLRVQSGTLEQTIAVDQIVLATGKRPHTQNLNLGLVGVDIDERSGAIKTNQVQQTTMKHIFAAGDVDGGMMFTHTAHHEGYIAGYNAAIVAKKKRIKMMRTDERVVPRVTFLEPEVASVGQTAQEVKEKQGSVLVGRYEIGTLGRAVTDNSRSGLIKVVVHPKTRKVLGGQMIGARAGEVIHEIALAIYLNATVDKLAGMIHAFPTFSEGVKAAAASVQLE